MGMAGRTRAMSPGSADGSGYDAGTCRAGNRASRGGAGRGSSLMADPLEFTRPIPDVHGQGQVTWTGREPRRLAVCARICLNRESG